MHSSDRRKTFIFSSSIDYKINVNLKCILLSVQIPETKNEKFFDCSTFKRFRLVP
jgi:hypothetical protein